MASHQCKLCGKQTLFYVWTSSRVFPRQKLIKAKELKNRSELDKLNQGYPVCFWCLEELKNTE